MPEQTPFQLTTRDFADNPDPRCPTLLLLDVSGSMQGNPLAELQSGVELYRDELAADSLASRRVEVAVVTFGGAVKAECQFVEAASFHVPQFIAGGDTPMAQAVVTGLDMLQQRKTVIRQSIGGLYRPWVFLITDGAPTDANSHWWPEAVRRVREGEQNQSFLFFAIGVQGADMARLTELSAGRPALSLQGMRFRDLFRWLSASQKKVSASQPGMVIDLPPTDCFRISI